MARVHPDLEQRLGSGEGVVSSALHLDPAADFQSVIRRVERRTGLSAVEASQDPALGRATVVAPAGFIRELVAQPEVTEAWSPQSTTRRPTVP